MAKFTQFGWNQYGELVYRNTGRLAPSDYYVKGNTVYKGTRKQGQIGKGTKSQQKIIRRAATVGGRKKTEAFPNRFSFENIKKARQKAIKTVGKVQLVRPPPSGDQIKKFGRSVKNMALLTVEQNPALREKIMRMDDGKLMQLYMEDEILFDVYFDYGGVSSTAEGKRGNRETAKNAQALIDVYEERYGLLPVQTTLV